MYSLFYNNTSFFWMTGHGNTLNLMEITHCPTLAHYSNAVLCGMIANKAFVNSEDVGAGQKHERQRK